MNESVGNYPEQSTCPVQYPSSRHPCAARTKVGRSTSPPPQSWSKTNAASMSKRQRASRMSLPTTCRAYVAKVRCAHCVSASRQRLACSRNLSHPGSV